MDLEEVALWRSSVILLFLTSHIRKELRKGKEQLKAGWEMGF